MSTIKDVAKLAGVGAGTVSRALSGNGYVSEKTKKKIIDAVNQLEYTINNTDRASANQKTGFIAVVIPDIESPFFAQLCKEIEMNLFRAGYHMMICNTVGISNREGDYLNMLQNNSVDGLIVGTHSLNDEAYLTINKPIVAFDRDFGSEIPLIHSDHEKGGLLAATEMINAGCKNIIQFSTSSLVNTPSNKRHEKFSKVCYQNGTTVTTIEMGWNSFGFSDYYSAMKTYLGKFPEIDGIFTADIPAVFCYKVLKQLGKRIPEDVKVMGYDGVDLFQYATSPRLTTIKQDIPKIAKTCVENLLEQIKGEKNVASEQIIDVSLIKGDTV